MREDGLGTSFINPPLQSSLAICAPAPTKYENYIPHLPQNSILLSTTSSFYVIHLK